MTETYYWGNKGVKKFCCQKCEPEILANKQRMVKRVQKWREDQPDIKERRNAEARKYRAKHGDKVRHYRRGWYDNNKESMQEYRRNYIKENPWFNRASSSKKRAAVRQRLPAWADIEALKAFYRGCPEGMVVDHIIPLQGKHVSGLHIVDNLQYLTQEENQKKWNHYDVSSVILYPVKIWGREI